MRDTWLVIGCPKCQKKGFLSARWTRSSYFPQIASAKTMAFESYYQSLDAGREISSYLRRWKEANEQSVRVFEYTGKCSIDEKNNSIYEYRSTSGPGSLGKRHDIKLEYGSRRKIRKRIFQARRRREVRYYVGHYDSRKYREKTKQYKEGKIKSRPNGRTWCSLNDNVYRFDMGRRSISLGEYYEFYSSLRRHDQSEKQNKTELLSTVLA